MARVQAIGERYNKTLIHWENGLVGLVFGLALALVLVLGRGLGLVSVLGLPLARVMV